MCYVWVCSFTMGDLYYGAFASTCRAKQIKNILDFLQNSFLVDPYGTTSEMYGRIKAELNKISVKASEDIENIWLYTFWSLEQADRYVNLIFDEIEYLSGNPMSGKDFSHNRESYLCSKVKSHVIF